LAQVDAPKQKIIIMKNRLPFWFVFSLWLTAALVATAQGNTFTYQGRLTTGGSGYSGSAEFQATLWSVPSGGTVVASNAPTAVLVDVTNGLFVLPLNFGANFPGADRWLQLEVRTNLGSFTTLSPRQQLTPTPYALTAANASNLTSTLPAAQLSGALPSANLSGTYSGALTLNNAANSFTGSGAGLTALNASQLTSGTVPDARLASNVARTNQVWLLGGNASTTAGTHFLGTADNQPLELKVNGLRALRLEPKVNDATHSNIVNVIGGSSGNFVGAGVYGATIGGGGAVKFDVFVYTNRVEGDFGTLSGGAQNTIQTDAFAGTIGGGSQNTIQSNAYYATISGGGQNTIQTNAAFTTIGGGAQNTVQSNTFAATIGGGYNNTIGTDADSATISGGRDNTIQISAARATIGGGSDNLIETNASSTTIGGGVQNKIRHSSFLATIGGGVQNTIQTNADYATIGGGIGNTIQPNGEYGTIPGGRENSATNYAFAAGRRAKANHTGSFVWGDAQNADVSSTGTNQFLIRASGGVGIGTTSPNSHLHVNGDGVDPSLRVQVSGSSKLVVRENGGTSIGANVTPPADGLYVSGDVGIGRTPAANALEVAGDASKTIAGNWLANSDARIKTGVRNVTHALEKLARVRPVEFRYTDEYRAQHPGIEDRPYLNVIAQEFQKVFPEAVKSSGEKLPNGEPILQVDTYPLTIYSAAAIQELNQKVDSENATLRAENAALKLRLEKLEQLIRQK
jgi:hypothetical protein